MDLFSDIQLAEVVSMIFYAGLSFGLFSLFWWIITHWAPFPVVSEIEDDHNVAVAVVIGCAFIALAIIIAAVIIS